MKILSIDTSSKICGVAVLEDTSLIKEIVQDNGLTHSETLMPIIKETLDSINMSLNDINLIVCDKGPGSFTGIRIGVATAKAFSDCLNIQEIGISSLEALAYNVRKVASPHVQVALQPHESKKLNLIAPEKSGDFSYAIKTNEVICSLIDAKNDNVYTGVFENIDGDYILRRNFSCENIYDLLDEFKNTEYLVTFVGDGAVNYKEKILSVLGKKCEFVENNDLSCYNLGLAGFAHFKKDDLCDVNPLYLRKPQAERMLENKNK